MGIGVGAGLHADREGSAMGGSLGGKIAIVTGASRGIGAAIARELAGQGAVVTLVGRDEAALASECAAITAAGGAAPFSVSRDLREPSAPADVTAAVLARFGRLDILVNNAGISGSAVGDPLSLEGWNRLMAVNATGTFLGTSLAAQEMAKAGRGSIVNISSIMGFIGGAEGHPGYSASKGAVRLLTKSAAVRWGPQGVRVNSVHPGYLPAMLGGTNAGTRAAKIPQTPLRRLGEPLDVAYGVLFLASDEASFITGTELVIDGGYIAQ
jgi:NAD(P)-dependent dehydrogenase (short-subunit alcohol dehydrogenase family)